MAQFDVIVIGSGFGDAVTACRLAEKGLKVLVLERGRRWKRQEFPSVTNKDYIWDRQCPERLNGWFDFRVFKDMTVVQGAGVGGGSLVYANISIEAKDELFNQGWPPEITVKELRPYYDRVGAMLIPTRLPENQLTKRFQIMREGAEALGYGARFRPLDIAITFDPAWTYEQPDPFNYAKSKPWKNAQGIDQGTCVHCGNCDLGCPTGARNTLDLNYIPQAENQGAEVRPLHLVDCITPAGNSGYRVDFKRLENGSLIPGSETAPRV